MNKEIKKLEREEKERINNKLVIVFATALGSIMLLLYLMNWFRGAGGFVMAARIITYVVMAGSLAATILFGIISKKAKASGMAERAEKFKNWKWVMLGACISAFIVYPTELISLLRFIGLYAPSQAIIGAINRFNFVGHNIASRIVIIMILIAAVTIAIFIYYGLYLNKAHKASLNKGAKKTK